MKMNFFLPYLLVIVIVTVLTGLVYAAVQQSYRTGADDPQIQLAMELQNRLKQGRPLTGLLPDSIRLEESMGIFATLYDQDMRPLVSSATLDGTIPQLPRGVFQYVKTHEKENVTWQPRPQIRMAMVVVLANQQGVAYIAVGRSLQQVEIRESNLRMMSFLAWSVIFVLIGITALIQFRVIKK